MFSCEFSEISQNTFFAEHLWATASIFRLGSGREELNEFSDGKLKYIELFAVKNLEFDKKYIHISCSYLLAEAATRSAV